MNGALSKGAALPLVLALPVAATAAVLPVSDESQLLAALAVVEPGDEVVLAPGEYLFVRTSIRVDRPGAPGAPVTVRAEVPGCARLAFDAPGAFTEGFLVTAPHWIFEDLVIEGRCADDSQCEHAFHVVGEADFLTVRRCILRNFNAQVKGNGGDTAGGFVFPDDVVLESNHVYDEAPRVTGNPVTPFDIVGGRRWIVRRNFIHDAAKAGADGVSYQAFLKGNGRSGLFDANVVACAWLHAPTASQFRVGLSFGGGGSAPDPICEDGDCSVEHRDGLMRNNVIVGCNDVGIYLNEAAGCRVHHNSLHDTVGIDVRFVASTVELRNNLLTGRIRERDGGSAVLGTNVEQVGNAAFESWFADPAALDFRLVGDGSSFVDRGEVLAEVPLDVHGRPRDALPDLGAIEHGGELPELLASLGLLEEPDGSPANGPGGTLRLRAEGPSAAVLLTWAASGDTYWNVYRQDAPDVPPGSPRRLRLTAPSHADDGALRDGADHYYRVRAVEPCTGAEAD